ncbi:MAG TPA: nicotinate-nucleotide diphosphorylase (carboxylating), partial [Solirubrobacteraceae bacterium]|nr:nicotinate-nucleotide diphosphorylase (carboxylating) [Solirubrobacteraceae bacterium]
MSELDMASLVELVERALAEDMGSGDVTSEATVPQGTRARASIVQKADGVVFGVDAALQAFAQLDPRVAVEDRGV